MTAPDVERAVLDAMSDGVYVVDTTRTITYWSAGAERLTGFRAEDVVGRRCYDGLLDHVDDRGDRLCGTRCPLQETMRDGRDRDVHVSLHDCEGTRRPVWVRASALRAADGSIAGAVEVFSDDSAGVQTRTRLARAEARANRDELTGLGNRRVLESHLDARLVEWRRCGARFGVLFVDVDEFKDVNDAHGHAAGDRALAGVAGTLRDGVRGSDVVCRYGGEEFVVVVGEPSPGSLLTTAERLRRRVEDLRLVVGGVRVPVTVSVGGTLVADGDTAASLLARADRLLYDAKDRGRNAVHVDA